MTKKIRCLALLLSTVVVASAQPWQPAGDRIKTRWAESVCVEQPSTAYPRPAMERREWLSLDGLWQYALTAGEAAMPARFDGELLVPFVPRSSLSGLGRGVAEGRVLWYGRSFRLPAGWSGKRVLLHLDGVAGRAEIFVNGRRIGESSEGRFSGDIAEGLSRSGDQSLVVKVIPDHTAAGLWQTVWLEPVGEKYLTAVQTVVAHDLRSVVVAASSENFAPGDIVEAELYDGQTRCAKGRAKAGQEITLAVDRPKCWTPDAPEIYTLKVRLKQGSRIVDELNSYCVLRTYASENGRLQLNGRPFFALGVLDRCWWPDGLRTPPCNEALVADLARAKQLGFNTLCASEEMMPARWRYHCDRLGLVVWQDIVAGKELLTLSFTDESDPVFPQDVADVVVVAEFGEMELPLHDHIWNPEKNWGYVKYRTRDEVTARYAKYVAALRKMRGEGLAAAVCMQLTDFEGDVSGLQTADRKALKVNEQEIIRLNKELCEKAN